MAKEKRLPLIDIVAARFPGIGREQIKGAILFGDVELAGERCRDPKRLFPAGSAVSVRGPVFETEMRVSPDSIPLKPFVSRGGEKLDKVLAAWEVRVADRVWMDAGCSTGGFSHALLLRGASVVHAVDVGYNVLDWRLRQLSRIQVHERTNVMGLEKLDPLPDAAVADLSFRSMEGPAQKILSLCRDNELYALIKPQFERKYAALSRSLSTTGHGQSSGKTFRDPAVVPDGVAGDYTGTGAFDGVVADGGERMAILRDLAGRLARHSIIIEKIAEAGVRGRGGNQEYIALLRGSDLPAAEVAGHSLHVIAALPAG